MRWWFDRGVDAGRGAVYPYCWLDRAGRRVLRPLTWKWREGNGGDGRLLHIRAETGTTMSQDGAEQGWFGGIWDHGRFGGIQGHTDGDDSCTVQDARGLGQSIHSLFGYNLPFLLASQRLPISPPALYSASTFLPELTCTFLSSPPLKMPSPSHTTPNTLHPSPATTFFLLPFRLSRSMT